MCDGCIEHQVQRVAMLLAYRVAGGDREFAEYADRMRTRLLSDGFAELHGVPQATVDASLRDFNECYGIALAVDPSKMGLELVIVERDG